MFSVLQLKLGFNKAKVTPATKVKLTMKAKPETEVFVLVVDKSVLLLKSGNDITKDLVKYIHK